MGGRAPGPTTMSGLAKIDLMGNGWDKSKFRNSGGGCGGSMRSACIGLCFYADIVSKLIPVAVESCRITHHHPTGYLGTVAAALFTALAILHVPIELWGAVCLELIPAVKRHIKQMGL